MMRQKVRLWWRWCRGGKTRPELQRQARCCCLPARAPLRLWRVLAHRACACCTFAVRSTPSAALPPRPMMFRSTRSRTAPRSGIRATGSHVWTEKLPGRLSPPRACWIRIRIGAPRSTSRGQTARRTFHARHGRSSSSCSTSTSLRRFAVSRPGCHHDLRAAKSNAAPQLKQRSAGRPDDFSRVITLRVRRDAPQPATTRAVRQSHRPPRYCIPQRAGWR
mmetsp:Transcript_18646/g.57915  ORF Transcript_18646/g.57915 Transcript_18646/m.57915 type:complete len:220 (+) Transcript_18646:2203-2862(+)